MVSLNLKNWLKKGLYFLIPMFGEMNVTLASTSGNLPFVSTMNMLKDSISGPFLMSAGIIMIVVTCLMLAFGEWGDGFKKLINIVLWFSLAFSATSFITTMFGGGAVF